MAHKPLIVKESLQKPEPQVVIPQRIAEVRVVSALAPGFENFGKNLQIEGERFLSEREQPLNKDIPAIPAGEFANSLRNLVQG
ncbi:MAG: hypothetical protein PHU63_03385 [Candidatus ainarchaeum sp.]|nr:hypothetical protein [Candidatus ainarchaeum sp.]